MKITCQIGKVGLRRKTDSNGMAQQDIRIDLNIEAQKHSDFLDVKDSEINTIQNHENSEIKKAKDYPLLKEKFNITFAGKYTFKAVKFNSAKLGGIKRGKAVMVCCTLSTRVQYDDDFWLWLGQGNYCVDIDADIDSIQMKLPAKKPISLKKKKSQP